MGRGIVDIEPVVVKGARQGSVGALLGGALACLVLGPGAIWQAITNHVDPAHPIGTAHTNYLPPAGRVIMFIIGALLSLLALILLLAAAVQANQRSKVTFTAGGVRFENSGTTVQLGWKDVTAIEVGTGDDVALLISSPKKHQDLEELSPDWYRMKLGRGERLAADLGAGVRKFRPDLFRGVVQQKSGQP
ncbi:hypothetical protein [Fodinicola feengrottensis]|uniref:hypothetical protein n=1 Tax=Fodinicola feengrottensis TaxID=435914 RepID=UPI0031DF397B